MRSTVDTKKLAVAVRAKRGAKSLRDAAAETGLNRQTISNIEKGSKPDLDTFVTLCNWMGLDSGYFLIEDEEANDRRPVHA